MESLVHLFDLRLKTQETEVADLKEFLKKRADLERKHSNDLQALEKQMFGKHKVSFQEASKSSLNLRPILELVFGGLGDGKRPSKQKMGRSWAGSAADAGPCGGV